MLKLWNRMWKKHLVVWILKTSFKLLERYIVQSLHGFPSNSTINIKQHQFAKAIVQPVIKFCCGAWQSSLISGKLGSDPKFISDLDPKRYTDEVGIKWNEKTSSNRISHVAMPPMIPREICRPLSMVQDVNKVLDFFKPYLLPIICDLKE